MGIESGKSKSYIEDKLKKIVKAIELAPEYKNMLSVSFGFACSDGGLANDFEAMIRLADTEMYNMKKKWREK